MKNTRPGDYIVPKTKGNKRRTPQQIKTIFKRLDKVKYQEYHERFIHEVICLSCSRPFMAQHLNARTCSNACRQKYYRTNKANNTLRV